MWYIEHDHLISLLLRRLALGAGDCACPSAWGVTLWQQDTKHLTAEMDKNIGLQFAPLLHSQENSNSWGRHFGIFGNRLARPHYSHEARHRSWGVPNVTVATHGWPMPLWSSLKRIEVGANQNSMLPVRQSCFIGGSFGGSTSDFRRRLCRCLATMFLHSIPGRLEANNSGHIQLRSAPCSSGRCTQSGCFLRLQIYVVWCVESWLLHLMGCCRDGSFTCTIEGQTKPNMDLDEYLCPKQLFQKKLFKDIQRYSQHMALPKAGVFKMPT
jgi:hypothetical protein